jgi:nitronate monooxygenase
MTDTTFLGTPLPLIQSPMAGAQDAHLAIAVSQAGALGSLPAAMLDAASLERELRRLQAAGCPYNVNFFVHSPPAPDAAREARWMQALDPYYREFGLDPAHAPSGASRQPFSHEAAEVLEAFRPPVVSFHFGLPAPELLARVKRMGSRVLSSATTVREALWLQAQGADAVIAQGLEAGGHRGHFLDKDVTLQADTALLLPSIVAALDIPVIAAGGIADAQGVRAAIALGASGVQVGTAFLLCDEALTSTVHRAALKDLQAPTALTNVFTGGLARGIVNRVMREQGPVSQTAPPFPLATAGMGPLRSHAEAAGAGDFSPLWSGTNRSGCRAAPAAEIVRALARGFDSD